jgi:hypothetical protein
MKRFTLPESIEEWEERLAIYDELTKEVLAVISRYNCDPEVLLVDLIVMTALLQAEAVDLIDSSELAADLSEYLEERVEKYLNDKRKKSLSDERKRKMI